MPFSLRRWIASIDKSPNANVKLETIDLSTYCRTCMNETTGTDFYMLDSTDNVTLGNETLEQILQKLIGVEFSEVSVQRNAAHSEKYPLNPSAIIEMQAEHTELIQPTRICLTCCELLTRYYIFRNECLQSHKALQKYIHLLSEKTNEQHVEDVPPIFEDTTTFIELNKDTSTSTDSVVIKVEVDDEEYIIGTVLEDDPIDDSLGDGNNMTYEINEQRLSDLMEDGAEGPSEIDQLSVSIALKQLREAEEDQRNDPRSTFVIENMCQLCNRIFSKRKQLTKHLNTHIPDNKCPYCDKYFEKKFVLRRHLKSHSGKIKSTYCIPNSHKFASFVVIAILKCSPLFEFSGVRPYKAICCYKRFKRKDEMQDHVKHHTGKMENQKLAYMMLKQSDLIAMTT